jgi:hypothetical protein
MRQAVAAIARVSVIGRQHDVWCHVPDTARPDPKCSKIGQMAAAI